MKTVNIMYWVTIVMSFVVSFMGNWQMSMGFLIMSSMFMCTEQIIKEMQRGKREEGNANSTTPVVETST